MTAAGAKQQRAVRDSSFPRTILAEGLAAFSHMGPDFTGARSGLDEMWGRSLRGQTKPYQ